MKINNKKEIIDNLKIVKNEIKDLPNARYKNIPTRIHWITRLLNNVINEIEDELVERE